MKFISFCKHHLSDVISIGITLVLLIATFVGTIFLLPQTGGDTVEVYYRNKLVDTFDLNVNRKVTFCKSSTSADNCDYEGFTDFQGETIVLAIQDNSIQVIEETSKKKLCSTQGKIKLSNLPIVCLPNSFMAIIKGTADGEFDI